jgi:N6-L-threonylcarbamoyladenine synthase
MPTARHGRVRRLLERGQAKVVRRTPFTIQLTYDTEGITQPVTLGIDAGSKTVGVSATTGTKELYAAECKLRADVTKNLSTRREFRKARRNRKTRYRAPRFNNRIRGKHKGWLAPSIEQKINTHIQLIKTICDLLPITKIVIETAEFDTQRLKAMLEGRPLPVGADYQLGEQYDEYNTRQYISTVMDIDAGYAAVNMGIHRMA